MSLKHKPGTELPWTVYEAEFLPHDDDLQYATHAANCYGKLVEAIQREIAPSADGFARALDCTTYARLQAVLAECDELNPETGEEEHGI